MTDLPPDLCTYCGKKAHGGRDVLRVCHRLRCMVKFNEAVDKK